MNMNEYQEKAAETARYSNKNKDREARINYCVVGLIGEAGEVADAHKKYLRGTFDKNQHKATLIEECGDVLWYMAMLAHELDIPFDMVAGFNLLKLRERYKQSGGPSPSP